MNIPGVCAWIYVEDAWMAVAAVNMARNGYLYVPG